MSMLEKFLSKAAGGLGKAKGAAEWAAKEHPLASGLGAGAALGAGANEMMGDDEPDGDEDDKEELKMLLAKLGLS